MELPKLDEWTARLPDLKKKGKQLEGPCPICGGKDRFSVDFAPPHHFRCRNCLDKNTSSAYGAEILRKVFGNAGEGPRRRNSDFVDAVYRHPDGRETTSYRKDWPRDWDGRPCDYQSCKAATQHKHVWRGKGQPSRGLLLKLWEPDKPVDADLVVIVEGEKAARAVMKAGYIAATYCGGTSAVNFADYSPVEGRPVLIWPDADKPGYRAAKKALQKAYEAQAFEVRFVPVDPKLSTGTDAADYSGPEEVSHIIAEAKENAEVEQPPDIGLDVQGPPSKAVEVLHPNAKGLSAILSYLDLELRLNVRVLRIEIRKKGPEAVARRWVKQWGQTLHPGNWIALADGIVADLRNFSRDNFQFQNEAGANGPANWSERDLQDALINNCPRPYTDPFKDWLETLPKWDGVPRMAQLWVLTLAMKDTLLNQEAARRFLIGAVRRCEEPGCVHDWIPVLVGPQGLGKSSILRELVTPSPEWFADGTMLDGSPKERMETTGPAVINEFSEMAGLERADAAKFKNYLSQRSDQLRPAYGRHTERTERRWVGAGTANPDPNGVLPPDSSGSRRFVVMLSTYAEGDNNLADFAQKARVWVKENREQLWAEAVHDYKKAIRDGDDRPNLIPGILRSNQESVAEGQRRQNEGLRGIAVGLASYARKVEEDEGHGVTLAALMKQGGLAATEADAAKDYSTQKYLSSELASLGWGKWRDSVGKGKRRVCWHAPKIAVEEGEPEFCTAKLNDGAPCGQPILDGQCNASDHADQDRDGGPPPGAATGGASDAGATQPSIDGVFTGAQLSMSVGIERKLTWLAGIENEFRAELRADPSSGEASLNLDQCAAYRLGLQGFKAANPDFKLNPGHVAALRGAEEVLDIIMLAMLKDKTAKAVVECPPDWKGVIGDLHRVAVERQQEERRELESRLKPDLLARTQPRLKGI